MAIVHKGFTLKLMSAEASADRGTFAGTALVYGEKDAGGDVIREGCFSKSISDAHGRFPCLWTHDPREVLGTITVEADARSLSVSGSLLTDVIPKAREVYGLLKAKALKGLSVGFSVLRAAPIENGGVEYIEGRLLEVSLCAIPAYQSAQVNEVRAIADLAKALDPQHDREALVALRDSITAMLEGTARRDVAAELAGALTGFDPGKWRR